MKRNPIKRKPKAVGQRIKAMRLALGLSQRALQDDGVTYAYISRIEAGTRSPSFEALIVLADKLDTTALELLTGKHDAHCPVCQRG